MTAQAKGPRPQDGGFNIQLQARTDLASGTGEMLIVTTFCPHDASEQAMYEKIAKVKKVLARTVKYNNTQEEQRQLAERAAAQAALAHATNGGTTDSPPAE